jgi:Four helix bundle sensory module for signal transduction
VSTAGPDRRTPGLLPSIVALLVLLLAVLGAYLFGTAKANRGLEATFAAMLKKAQLISDMQVKLLANAEAEKSAVMAETDEASDAFAQEARRASSAVDADQRELGGLIEIDKRPEEVARFNDFSSCWKRYQEVDHEILGLAVENTNLKALRLSFVPASEALDRMQAALDKLVDDSSSSAEAALITKAACRALTAALEIHGLESRHIAAAQDEDMDRIEAKMKTLDGQVTDGFSTLSTSTGEAEKATLAEARSSYTDFQKVNKELLDLSRRNSNVRSLAISLGQKRKVTAECQDLLSALQEAVRSERFKATR